MMSSKGSRKFINTRSLPMRKDHMVKKPVRHGSPIRSSRVLPMKRLSPGLKRGNVMIKGSHSPKIKSFASSPHRPVAHHSMQSSQDLMDRSRGYKKPKYEKRKIPSISPVRHPSPPPMSLSHQERTPQYHDDRYRDSRPVAREERMEPLPTKKKIRRDSGGYVREQSSIMMHKSNEIPFITDNSGLNSRSDISPNLSSAPMSRSYLSPDDRVERSYRTHHSPPPAPTNQMKRPVPPMKSTYNSSDRYDIPSSDYTTVKKTYHVTLNERFSSVDTVPTEPRIRYSREDLEKITIDIHRNLKEPSPTLRQIVNPSDVKLVRRTNEGHRPIFDRDEIKQAPRDMREDAYYEKKIKSDGSYHQPHSTALREAQSFEITRHRFDGHQQQQYHSNSRPVSDRWPTHEDRKESLPLDRDERDTYEKIHPKKSFVDVRSRSKTGDLDFRSERYTETEVSRSRSDYREPRNLSPPPDPRPQIIYHKESPPDMRRKLVTKRNRSLSPIPHSSSRSHFHEKTYHGSPPREKHYDRHSPVTAPPKYRSRSGGREEKSSDYSRKIEKYHYKSYPDKQGPSPSYVRRGREDSGSYRSRGSRPFRSPRGAFRSRGFRGMSRGGFRGRGSFTRSFRGSSTSPRGRGAPRSQRKIFTSFVGT